MRIRTYLLALLLLGFALPAYADKRSDARDQVSFGIDVAQPLTNPRCHAVDPDPRCAAQPGFDSPTGPRLHLNFSPKL